MEEYVHGWCNEITIGLTGDTNDYPPDEFQILFTKGAEVTSPGDGITASVVRVS